ncbi:hypothetical protein AAHE18_19G189200 [Arachis hypogaea]
MIVPQIVHIHVNQEHVKYVIYNKVTDCSNSKLNPISFGYVHYSNQRGFLRVKSYIRRIYPVPSTYYITPLIAPETNNKIRSVSRTSMCRNRAIPSINNLY